MQSVKVSSIYKWAWRSRSLCGKRSLALQQRFMATESTSLSAHLCREATRHQTGRGSQSCSWPGSWPENTASGTDIWKLHRWMRHVLTGDCSTVSSTTWRTRRCLWCSRIPVFIRRTWYLSNKVYFFRPFIAGCWYSGAASPKTLGVENIWRGAKIFYFRRATVFCLGYYFSKHKMTRYAKNLGWLEPLATLMRW